MVDSDHWLPIHRLEISLHEIPSIIIMKSIELLTKIYVFQLFIDEFS